ncbi:FKBP-type peptidyl-prolyl cis-trans isomerase [Muriicola sp. Z0-33]|uniref:FKBP-type peptidyl-prolyl cis-trans isomerase n=1 Tax=Muriicola sp. Z0-33 TaxID=2816957 RepID=UPI00223808BA|nr:FKBP-type peptidyl-prolyl cis-trans isomerase [Muriicola sp. Z0-33]MCW5516757.1 FKBP-type peptidyl-prolyl cis-trans isomerase [Muriicola sp. Z0-33]
MNYILKGSIRHLLGTLLLIGGLLACKDNKSKEVTLESGLRYVIISPGKGRVAANGNEVIIEETMGYEDGTLLYSSKDRGVNQPRFVLGAGMVIEGVEQGVKGMRMGEVRKIIVPPHLSKREVYPDFLSPDSTLVYTIKLLTVN